MDTECATVTVFSHLLGFACCVRKLLLKFDASKTQHAANEEVFGKANANTTILDGLLVRKGGIT